MKKTENKDLDKINKLLAHMNFTAKLKAAQKDSAKRKLNISKE